jgi:hypothetical protein
MTIKRPSTKRAFIAVIKFTAHHRVCKYFSLEERASGMTVAVERDDRNFGFLSVFLTFLQTLNKYSTLNALCACLDNHQGPLASFNFPPTLTLEQRDTSCH